jgi:hypothetical protein
MKQKQIQLLEKQIDKLNASDFDLEAWKVSTQILLTQLFGKFDAKTITIRDLKIDYSSNMLRDSNANYKPIDTCKRKGKEVLELAIAELELFRLDDPVLQQLVDQQRPDELRAYLKKLRKDDLIDLLEIFLIKS